MLSDVWCLKTFPNLVLYSNFYDIAKQLFFVLIAVLDFDEIFIIDEWPF